LDPGIVCPGAGIKGKRKNKQQLLGEEKKWGPLNETGSPVGGLGLAVGKSWGGRFGLPGETRGGLAKQPGLGSKKEKGRKDQEKGNPRPQLQKARTRRKGEGLEQC